MGDVYRAVDSRLDRIVALKVLRPDTAHDPDRTRRFVREAKAVSALNHPNVVTIYEIGSADGVDFIALEYVEGTPLNQLITGQPLSAQRALDYARQIAEALAAAHELGIVHRDLKPANIMLTQSSDRDAIKVLDFGLAKRVDASDGLTLSGVTRHGAVVGTPAYMAPEQARGGSIDARADVFAFGSVLYEMLTGRPAFSRDSDINTLMAVMSGAVPPLTGVPSALARLVMRSLEKDPAARFGSGAELRSAIVECQARLSAEKHAYEFGPYRLDMGLSRLERAGEPLTIAPKTFDLLVLLARNPHRVLPKTELMETLWPNTFVDEGNLTQHIYTLRRALGDDPNGKPYIETVPRRGYRLAADVRQLPADGSAARTVRQPELAPLPTPPSAFTLPVSADKSRLALVGEGERKRATVLHCAIANAADATERLGAVEMHQFSETMRAVAREEVSRYDGVISQEHADEFVALFGAREVHEDDALRAILAAFQIEQRLAQFSSPASEDERITRKMGITTGPLVINRLSDAEQIEYVAVGDALRTAGLLQQFAPPGSILIGDATRRAVDEQVETVPCGEVAGAHAYRVTAVRPHWRTIRRIDRALVTFVGREREISLIDGLMVQAFAGHGQVVCVVGEPGMGKSRVVYEATRMTGSRVNPVTVLEGRCVSYGSLVPYLPLIDMLRAHCGVVETDSPESMQRAIDRAVRDNGLPPDARAWLLRLIGIVEEATARDTLSPEAVKARTFDALRLLFLKAATSCPLVIIVEDIHWIDRTSEEFLATLVGQLMAAPILLIATYRPGYRPPWMDRSYVTQMTIAPLSAADSARLLESVAGPQSITTDVSSAILRRGEGNPFFLEELARSAIDQGTAAEAIPETVHGVIMARLDRLPDMPKRLLQTASILGREVPIKLLSHIWDGPAQLDPLLAEVCRQEFMYERLGGDEPVYVFKHALTQDVAYDSLLARTRRDLHLRAAQALEALYADRVEEVSGTLAYHYARTDRIEAAVTWLTRAADQAARVYANAEAILHLDLAARRLQRLPEGSDRDRRMLDVALRHAHSLYFLGRFRDSVDVLLPHEARLARLGDPALTAAFSFWLAHMYSRLGDQRRAAVQAEKAIEAAQQAGDDATRGKAHGLLALEGHWAGRPREGRAHGEIAVTLLKPRGDQQWWLGMAHWYLATNYLLEGGFEAALCEAGKADAVGKAIGDPRLQTYAQFMVGWVELSRGNHDRAIAECRHSIEGAPDRVSRTYASMMLGFALSEKGAHEQSLELLADVVAELEDFGFLQWHGLALAVMGESARAQGRRDDAESFIERALKVSAQAQYGYALGFAHRVAGRIARDNADQTAATQSYAAALTVFDRIGATFEAARTKKEARASLERPSRES